MTKRLYIETVGCQMNVLDSELVVAALRKSGYELVDSPAKADAVLFNTCSVRQHAEDKIYSALGRLKHAKQHHPEKIIGVLGCMAQKDQRLIFQRAPFVDLVVGPGQLHQVPRLLEEIAADRVAGKSDPRLEVSLDRKAGSREEIERSFESYDPDRDPADAPFAVSGVCAHSNRLRQVLHLLHRAEGARARSRDGIPITSWPKPKNWPTKVAAKSRCWARP